MSKTTLAVVVVFTFILKTAFAGFPVVQSTTFDGVPENWFPDADTSPFVKIGAKYYFIDKIKKANWFEAVHICRTKNANLATIENESELNALIDHFEKENYDITNYYWTSANDLIEDKKYFWLSTGKPMSYSKFTPGNPDRYNNNEHCISIWYNRDMYGMNDFDCKAITHFICEASTPKTISFTIW